jgi:hypothetical protein
MHDVDQVSVGVAAGQAGSGQAHHLMILLLRLAFSPAMPGGVTPCLIFVVPRMVYYTCVTRESVELGSVLAGLENSFLSMHGH